MGLRSITSRGAAVAAAAAVGVLLTPSPASAATGNIDHVEPAGAELKIVVSLADVPAGDSPDLDTVTVSFDGQVVPAKAQPLSDADEELRRTTVLAMDVSRSMAGQKFEEAKAAADAFLDEVPDDVHVGLVTFADEVTVAHEPTRDLDSLRSALDALELTTQTRLYDGVLGAVEASGSEGARSILVLSDGRDTSDTSLDQVIGTVESAGINVDVVALAQSKGDEALLQQLAEAGNGQVVSADDPEALEEVFTQEAEMLAQQVLVTVTPPATMSGQEGTVSVTLQVDGEPVSDDAFVALPAGEPQVGGGELGAELQAVEPDLLIPEGYMYAGIVAVTGSVLMLLFLALGGERDKKQSALDRRIEAYTRDGAKKLAAAKNETDSSSMTQQAVAVAESVLDGQKGLEAALGTKLEAAGLDLKPAEWLLIHFGTALGFGVISLLFGGGNVLFMLVGLVLGVATPWLFLTVKRKRRLKAFNNQLADTLQLMAGSLSAGLSLAQSVDTVVREGTDPMAAEFRRALVETRLGVEIEDALSGVAERMQSVDFEWVVMAIRIQREVGGNLSELLNKVAETIREREYLERQVMTLSAEGRLSVWILGGLPPGFMLYLGLANPTYLRPMYTSPLGWVMLVVMAVLLTAGIFWMKKVVKVEV